MGLDTMGFRAVATGCLGVCLWAVTLARDAASQPADAKESDPVVVRVGQSEARASELAFRLSQLHAFERESFGSTPAAVRRAWLERVLVPELLFAEEARARGISERPTVRDRVRSVLKDALKSSLERDIDAALTRPVLRKYCQDNAGKTAAECDRDQASYRVVLRRTKAHEQLTALSAALEKTLVSSRDEALLERITITGSGQVLATPAAEREQREQ